MNSEIYHPGEYREHEFSSRLAELARGWFANHPNMPVTEPPARRRNVEGAADPVIDFGAGPGRYCDYFGQPPYMFKKIIGVEGCAAMTYRIQGAQQLQQLPYEMIQWDLAHPLWLGVKGNVMSVEVAEHLHADHHDTFMDTLSRHCSGKLLLTWATRGQGGLRHISERDQSEVVPYVARWGFRFLEEESNRWREDVGQQLSWFGKSIYLFER